MSWSPTWPINMFLHIECSDLNAVDGDNESNELTREGIGLHIRGFNITYRSLLFQLIVAILYFLLVGWNSNIALSLLLGFGWHI